VDRLAAVAIASLLAFATTNIDGLVVLVLFFSQVGPRFRAREVVLGEYLGFSALTAASALGALGALLVPPEWLGLLGLVPIALGLRRLAGGGSARASGQVDPEGHGGTEARRATGGAPTFEVAAATIANGGDNLSVYIPLFASLGPGALPEVFGVFCALVGAWCYVGYRLGRHPLVARAVARRGQRLVPFVLVGVGVYVLAKQGTPAWLAGAVSASLHQ
jgi:cadmium resistance protein CadD (predicted permease)